MSAFALDAPTKTIYAAAFSPPIAVLDSFKGGMPPDKKATIQQLGQMPPTLHTLREIITVLISCDASHLDPVKTNEYVKEYIAKIEEVKKETMSFAKENKVDQLENRVSDLEVDLTQRFTDLNDKQDRLKTIVDDLQARIVTLESAPKPPPLPICLQRIGNILHMAHGDANFLKTTGGRIATGTNDPALRQMLFGMGIVARKVEGNSNLIQFTSCDSNNWIDPADLYDEIQDSKRRIEQIEKAVLENAVSSMDLVSEAQLQFIDAHEGECEKLRREHFDHSEIFEYRKKACFKRDKEVSKELSAASIALAKEEYLGEGAKYQGLDSNPLVSYDEYNNSSESEKRVYVAKFRSVILEHLTRNGYLYAPHGQRGAEGGGASWHGWGAQGDDSKVTCPQCNSLVQMKDDTCPNCGYVPDKEKEEEEPPKGAIGDAPPAPSQGKGGAKGRAQPKW